MNREQAIYERLRNTELPLTNEQTAGEKMSVLETRTPCSFWENPYEYERNTA